MKKHEILFSTALFVPFVVSPARRDWLRMKGREPRGVSVMKDLKINEYPCH